MLEERTTKDIVDIYQKDKKPKKKTFFDELWEKDHPQEALEL